MAGIASGIYKQAPSDTPHERLLTPSSAIFRRNQVFLVAVFGGAFIFEIGFDKGLTKWWDWNNKGRQWKDIRHKYVQNEEDE
ncbi:qcr9 subunit 9 of the ubiquinol cytochrome-c reductase complex [Puttea exsequens]|nr:qcr9 subunit 9 of the ubiquinol cytochrome-c reductase complex [Puttea exsequens]